MTTITWAVRRPGCVAWSHESTQADAMRERDVANRICPGHIVVATYKETASGTSRGAPSE